MTRNLPMFFRRQRASLAVLVTVVFAFAWILRLWLLALGCVAAAVVVLIRLHRRFQRKVLPAFIAGTAATWAPGVAAGIAVEDWAAIWLAVNSGGHADWLRRAAVLDWPLLSWHSLTPQEHCGWLRPLGHSPVQPARSSSSKSHVPPHAALRAKRAWHRRGGVIGRPRVLSSLCSPEAMRASSAIPDNWSRRRRGTSQTGGRPFGSWPQRRRSPARRDPAETCARRRPDGLIGARRFRSGSGTGRRGRRPRPLRPRDGRGRPDRAASPMRSAGPRREPRADRR